MTRLRYYIEPRTPYTRVEYEDSVQFDEFLIRNEHISFWDFILLDIRKQFLLLAYKLLKRNRGFWYVKNESSRIVELKTVEIDTQDCVYSYAKYVEEYYRHTGKPPKYLFVGLEQHKALQEFIFKEYFRFGWTERNPYSPDGYNKFVTEALGVIVVVSPFLKGTFLWSGDENT